MLLSGWASWQVMKQEVSATRPPSPPPSSRTGSPARGRPAQRTASRADAAPRRKQIKNDPKGDLAQQLPSWLKPGKSQAERKVRASAAARLPASNEGSMPRRQARNHVLFRPPSQSLGDHAPAASPLSYFREDLKCGQFGRACGSW